MQPRTQISLPNSASNRKIATAMQRPVEVYVKMARRHHGNDERTQNVSTTKPDETSQMYQNRNTHCSAALVSKLHGCLSSGCSKSNKSANLANYRNPCKNTTYQ